MVEKRTEMQVHSVTLQFVGPLAEKMADHFFIDWLDGGLDQVWEERLDDADIADSITYDWDPATRTFVIEGVAEGESEDSSDEPEADEDDSDDDETEGDDDDSDDESEDDDSDEDEDDEDESAAAAVEGERKAEEA